MTVRAFFLALSCSVALAGADPSALEILETRCLGCHGAAQMSDLDLRTRSAMLAGGKRGAAVVSGHPERSLLYQVVSGDHEIRMPAGGDPLAPGEVETLAAWIRDGAPWDSASELAEAERWWAFEPPSKPAPPESASNPVDAFIDAKLEEKGLEPLPRADRRTLIRRAYFDLHGLPPSPEAVERFVADDSPDAWAKLIDELLESPRYGERWGRHWLDVARYADTGGFETDIYFPNAWRYRDYVIESFNEDKPYNRFVREQIAGDELWPDDLELRGGYQIPEEKLEHLEARIGTGLYTIGPVYHEAALDGRQFRYEWLTDAVDTTAAAFLGLTLGCARCHDHKFDPLTQRDYHRMMAVFSGSEPVEEPVQQMMSRLGFYSGYPKLLKVQEYKDAIGRLDRKARKRAENEVVEQFDEAARAAYRTPEDERTPEQQRQAVRVERALTEAGLKENAAGVRAEPEYTPNERDEREQLIRELGLAALGAKFELPTATVLGDAPVSYPVHMTSRGDFRATGDVVSPGFPAALTEDGAEAPSENKRAALADWLADPEHPLTARVMVNRVWHWHFGRGIVGTPNDFGRQGDAPTHPELLDWLAVDFMENGWSVKRLHRQIMTSETYMRGSGPHEANSQLDSDNRYLWRMNRQRLDAETLRDAALAVSGELELEMGGRPVVPPLSEDEMRGLWSRSQWPVSLDPEQLNRRSVYLYVKRSFPLPMLTTFDQPDSSVSCARRDETTVAPQALALLNGDFMLEQATAFGERLRREDPDGGPDSWIHAAWRQALGRRPAAAELAAASELFEAAPNPEDALPQLGLLVFNLNEFLYVD